MTLTPTEASELALRASQTSLDEPHDAVPRITTAARRHEDAGAVGTALALNFVLLETALSNRGWPDFRIFGWLEAGVRGIGDRAKEASDAQRETLLEAWLLVVERDFRRLSWPLETAIRRIDGDHAALVERCGERLANATDTGTRRCLVGWMHSYHSSHNEYELAVPYVREVFELAPTLRAYEQLMRVSREAGCRDDARESVDGVLREHLPDIWILEALEEEDRAGAVDVWYESDDAPRLFNCAEALAEATEESHPHVARECYLELVDGYLERGGRKSYRKVCECLRRLRPIFEGLEEPGGWADLLEDLRSRNSGRPAFLDELSKAGWIEMPDSAREQLASKQTEYGPDVLPDTEVEDFLEDLGVEWLDQPWSDVLTEPSSRLFNALYHSDMTTMRDVVRRMDEGKLVRIMGIGSKTRHEVRATISRRIESSAPQ